MLFEEITKRLEELRQRIDLTTLHVDDREFENYIRSSIDSRLRGENLELVGSLSNSKAALLELLYTLFLEKLGFTAFWRYKNPKVLGLPT